MLADVIAPRFFDPYFSAASLPVVGFAIGAELIVFWWFQRGAVPSRKILVAVLSANLCSAMFGLAAGGFIPFGPSLLTVAIVYLLSYFASVVIEYGVYRLFARRAAFRRLLVAVTTSNLASYALLAASHFIIWSNHG